MAVPNSYNSAFSGQDYKNFPTGQNTTPGAGWLSGNNAPKPSGVTTGQPTPKPNPAMTGTGPAPAATTGTAGQRPPTPLPLPNMPQGGFGAALDPTTHEGFGTWAKMLKPVTEGILNTGGMPALGALYGTVTGNKNYQQAMQKGGSVPFLLSRKLIKKAEDPAITKPVKPITSPWGQPYVPKPVNYDPYKPSSAELNNNNPPIKNLLDNPAERAKDIQQRQQWKIDADKWHSMRDQPPASINPLIPAGIGAGAGVAYAKPRLLYKAPASLVDPRTYASKAGLGFSAAMELAHGVKETDPDPAVRQEFRNSLDLTNEKSMLGDAIHWTGQVNPESLGSHVLQGGLSGVGGFMEAISHPLGTTAYGLRKFDDNIAPLFGQTPVSQQRSLEKPPDKPLLPLPDPYSVGFGSASRSTSKPQFTGASGR